MLDLYRIQIFCTLKSKKVTQIHFQPKHSKFLIEKLILDVFVKALFQAIFGLFEIHRAVINGKLDRESKVILI